MKFNFEIESISAKILLAILFVRLVDLMTGGQLTTLFQLSPKAVLETSELWRLLTYPVVSVSVEEYMLLIFTFSFFGRALEKVFAKSAFPLLLIMVSAVHATILTLLFRESAFQFSGSVGISLFVLTLIVLINPKAKILIFGRFSVSTITLIAAFVPLWFSSIYLHSILTSDYELFVTSSVAGICGIAMGLPIFLQLKLLARKDRAKDDRFELELQKPEDLTPELISKTKLRHISENIRKSVFEPETRSELTEDNLNTILEKINKNGKESLSPEELRFLEDYSRNI